MLVEGSYIDESIVQVWIPVLQNVIMLHIIRFKLKLVNFWNEF